MIQFIARARLILVCKASDQQKAAASQNQAFTANLQGMFQNQFGNSQAIQSQLNGQLQSLGTQYQNQLNQGEAGHGYSQGEESTLRTDASEGAAQQQIQAQQAAGQQIAERSQGGALNSGAVAQQVAQNANDAAASNAAAQRGITTQNANIARGNIQSGLAGLGSVDAATGGLAGTEASQADSLMGGANTSANQSYNEVTQAYQPSNFWGNLAGGALSAGLGAIAGPAGAAIGGGLSRAINGGGQDESNSDQSYFGADD